MDVSTQPGLVLIQDIIDSVEVLLLVAWSDVYGMYVIHNTPGSRYMS